MKDCFNFTVRCGIIQPLVALLMPSTGVREWGEGGVKEGRREGGREGGERAREGVK